MVSGELSYGIGSDSLMSSDWFVGFGNDSSEGEIRKFS